MAIRSEWALHHHLVDKRQDDHKFVWENFKMNADILFMRWDFDLLELNVAEYSIDELIVIRLNIQLGEKLLNQILELPFCNFNLFILLILNPYFIYIVFLPQQFFDVRFDSIGAPINGCLLYSFTKLTLHQI